MEKIKVLPVITAMFMITAMLIVSTPVAVAEHTPEVSITIEGRAKVAPAVRKTWVVTVTNKSGDKIDNVSLYSVPGQFTNFKVVQVLPKDNIVYIGSAVGENDVVLKAGTIVRPGRAMPAALIDNTVIKKKAGENIHIMNEEGTLLIEAYLETDAEIKIRSGGDYPLENTYDNLLITDNLKLLNIRRVSLPDNDVRTIVATDVESIGAENVAPIENMEVYKLGDNATGENILTRDDNLQIFVEKKVTLTDNLVNNYATLVSAVTATTAAGSGQSFPAGRRVVLDNDNLGHDNYSVAWLKAGTIIQVTRDENVIVPENTRLIIENGRSVHCPGITLENKTPGWIAREAIKTWTTTDEAKMIAAGGSLSFYFALTSPSTTTEDNYTFVVGTRDNKGGVKHTEVKITVDGVRPRVTAITVKDWAKGTENVGITVDMNEVITPTSAVWVTVMENNAPVPTTVTMSSTDNIRWTGTYTMSDNIERDGPVTITIEGDNYKDEVGNIGYDNSSVKLQGDRRKPPVPSTTYGGLEIDVVDKVVGTPGIQTNLSSAPVRGYAVDRRRPGDNNRPDNIRENVAGMTVKVRHGATTYELTSDANGAFTKVLTLVAGNNEIGVLFVDLAGNTGDNENVQTVFYDADPPVITPVRIAGVSYVDNVKIKDNKPKIELTIADPGYADNTGFGVDNTTYAVATNSGYTVQLLYDNDTVIATLTNTKHPWTKTAGEFENTYGVGLADGWYKVRVAAGDNLQSADNKILRFKIDTTKPAAPTLVTSYPTSTAAKPEVFTKTTILLSGTGEAGAEVRVYTSIVEPFTVDTLKTKATVGTDGMWNTSITVTAGVTTKISVSQVDEAGNESDKRLYGYVMTDATAPVISAVTIDGVKYTARVTTDKPSVIIAGKVTDDVSNWDEMTVRLSYAGVSLTLDRTKGATDKEIIFSKSVPLSEGLNTFTLTATDEAGNLSSAVTLEVERTVAPLTTYAIIIVIVALILAAIAIFVKK